MRGTRPGMLGFPLLVALIAAACGTSGSSTDAVTAGTSETQAAETSPAGPAGSLELRLVRVASGLSNPTHVAATASEPSRLYVVEQEGRIRVIQAGRLLQAPLLDIRELVSAGGERGLLSVAFHPNYATNRLFYVYYTARDGDNTVAEYRASPGGATRTRVLLQVDDPYANHNGGQLVFGPDGLLYAGTGDGGSGGDPENRAQNLSSRLGKLLRTDVDRSGADWETAGYGLRNPWRFSFDRQTGDLWIGDVGQNEWEEIDFLSRSGLGKLVNYGWDVLEGTHAYENKEPSGSGSLLGPVFEYNHSQGCSVTGGFVYRGAKVPAARGRYFFGDYCSGRIWSLVESGGKARDVKRHSFTVPQLTSFGENVRGELFLASGGGTIYRLARA